MSKFACRCGYVMNLSSGAPDFELALIPESRLEKIAEELDGPAHLGSEVFFELIDEVKTSVYRCPSCKRIHVDTGNGLFQSYTRESPG